MKKEDLDKFTKEELQSQLCDYYNNLDDIFSDVCNIPSTKINKDIFDKCTKEEIQSIFYDYYSNFHSAFLEACDSEENYSFKISNLAIRYTQESLKMLDSIK
jgi:hypothetical protein